MVYTQVSETEALRSKDDAPARTAPPPKPERTAPAPAPTQEAAIKPSRTRLLVLLMLAIALGIGGWLYLRPNRPVTGAFVILYGNVDIREVQPAFNNSGPVTRMLVQEGDAVKMGELIATLDDARFAAALAQAEGEMRNQEQVLARLLAGSRPEEIDQAKATMDALEVTYKNDEINYQRAQRLAETGPGRPARATTPRAAYDAAKHQYEAARQAYILAVKGPRKEDIAAARATLEADRARRRARQESIGGHAALCAVGRDRRGPHPGAGRHGLARDAGVHDRPYQARFGCGPMFPRAELGRIRLGMAATITHRQLSGARLSRLDRLSLAHLRVHAEDRGDAGAAHGAGLSAARLCLRCAGRAAARDAGDRAHRSEPAGSRRRRPDANPPMPPTVEPAPALRLEDVRRSFRSGKRVIDSDCRDDRDRGAGRGDRA